jgi:hypothetical protein
MRLSEAFILSMILVNVLCSAGGAHHHPQPTYHIWQCYWCRFISVQATMTHTIVYRKDEYLYH